MTIRMVDHEAAVVVAKNPARKWRVLGAIALVGAVGALVANVAFGLLTANGSGYGSASTGSVSFGAPVQSTCNYAHMVPGDSIGPCTLAVTYNGTISAYEALSVLIETKAGTGAGARTLYDPSTGNGLTMTVKDNQGSPVTYTLPTTVTACPVTAPAGSTCYELDHELVSTTPVSNPNPVTFKLSPVFASATKNPYQGGTASVIFTVNAVQAPANPISCSSTSPSVSPPTAGKPCAASGSFAWSS
jgi:hypothetical protein